jgi:hypothetical protein
MDHERVKISESSNLTDQGDQISMNFVRNGVVEALMGPFVIIESDVALEPSLQMLASLCSRFAGAIVSRQDPIEKY